MVKTGFVEDAKGVLQELRNALAFLVDSAGADATQPQEMSRRFGLDKTLTWKIARIVCDNDAWGAASHIPGKAGIRTFVDALERAGASPQKAQSVRSAMEQYERLIEVHSGDRDTFEIMLGSVSDQLGKKQAEANRKMAYQGNSAMCGVQTRGQLCMQFVAPNSNPDLLDTAIICGFVDFRRLRPDALWAVASRMVISDDGTLNTPHSPSPMDPAISSTDVPLIREFCSDPVPDLRIVESAGRCRYEFKEGPIGNTAAATCILGWMGRGAVCKYRTASELFGEHLVYTSTPAEVLMLDLYVHRSCAFALKPEVAVYTNLPGGPIYPNDGRERGLIPVFEEIIDLGAGPPDTTAPTFPRYGQMVEYGIARLGHAPKDFHGFRFRLRYPPIPAVALYRYELPQKQ
jgi:hypothetical protein